VGKADKTRDVVCLIEGKITVARDRVRPVAYN
jgi:hypothetical protein